jgi:hypothetical protein
MLVDARPSDALNLAALAGAAASSTCGNREPGVT